MTRAPDDHDFSDADVDSDADPSALRRLVLAQFHEPGGAAVQLFTTATLSDEPADAGPGVGGTVAATAHALGLDLERVELFTSDAYLLQSALGERSFDPGTPTDELVAGRWAALEASPVIACNYHDVPAENRTAVEERLRRLRDLGEGFDLDRDVTGAGGPRILVGLYDAYREAGLFGAELCERLGIRAMLFPVFEENDEPGCAGLRDDELADLGRRHELGFHTASHVRADEVTEANVQHEVLDVLDRLTALRGSPPRIGAWRGGTRWSPDTLGDRTLIERGITTVMSNWAIEVVPTA